MHSPNINLPNGGHITLDKLARSLKKVKDQEHLRTQNLLAMSKLQEEPKVIRRPPSKQQGPALGNSVLKPGKLKF